MSERPPGPEARRIGVPAIGFALCGLLAVLAKLVYRPYVVSHGVPDLGLAGVLPNFLFAAGCAFGFALVFRMSPVQAAGTSLAANVLYELDQLRADGFEDGVVSSAGRTFDPWDLVAATLGAILAWTVLRGPERFGPMTGGRE